MKKCVCVISVGLATVGTITLVIFIYFLRTQVLSHDIYRAAVLQSVPYENSSLPIREILRRNLRMYLFAVSISYVNDVDMIVFPENGLYDSKNERSKLIGSVAEDIPNPKDSEYIPCVQKKLFKESPILSILSCLARYGGMYLVANMIDYKFCNGSSKLAYSCSNTDCPSDGAYLFKANVVFDKEGKLVAKYHQKHLLSESNLNKSNCTDDGYFETKFGSFLTIMSTDLFFKETQKAIKELSPESIAFPTNWQYHTPYHLFSSFQQSFAFTHNINLLSANAYTTETGTHKTGIYSGARGPLIESNNPDEYSRLLITNVPKNPKYVGKHFYSNRLKLILNNNIYYEADFEENAILQSTCESLSQTSDEDSFDKDNCFPININKTKSIKLQNIEDTVEICNNDLCCSITYKTQKMNEEYFFIAAYFNAVMHSSATPIETEACVLARCLSKNDQMCTHLIMESKTIFEEVEIRGSFKSRYITPFAFDSRIKLSDMTEWIFDGNSSISYTSFRNNSLLIFGLYGQDYKIGEIQEPV